MTPPTLPSKITILVVLFCWYSSIDGTSSLKSNYNHYPEEVHKLVVDRLSKTYNSKSGTIGTWSSWSAWSPCSRTCGTGVTVQSRTCLSADQKKNGAGLTSVVFKSDCNGRSQRFQFCNQKLCPGGNTDYRGEQCAFYNKTPFKNRYFQWIPFIDNENTCYLNCRAVGHSFYATLNNSVADGTTCGAFDPEAADEMPNKICIAGKCMFVGCDNILGSERKFDSCGVCGGTNSTCRIIAGIYEKSVLPFGYNRILTLPVGAENISVFHLDHSYNYLALRDKTGKYILNGPSALNHSGSFMTAGTLFSYKGPGGPIGDQIYGSGPLHYQIDVMLFYRSKNYGIKYLYSLKRNGLSTQMEYSYPTSDNGNSIAQHPISQEPYNGPLNDAQPSFTIEKPWGKSKKSRKNMKRSKNQKKRYMWILKGFTECSKTCGGGYQSGRKICVKRKDKSSEVPPQLCAALNLPAQEMAICNLKPCPPEWSAEPWSRCSVTCGLGVQLRHLKCIQVFSPNKSEELAESKCRDAHGVATAKVCELQACNGPPTWNVDPWSDCSADCGLGTRRRKVSCWTAEGDTGEEKCEGPEPPREELCDMGSCATNTWFFSEWSDSCGDSCDISTQRRSVYCSSHSTGKNDAESGLCDMSIKPSEVRSCDQLQKCTGTWFTGEWSKCDARCGIGRQHREVVCVSWRKGKYRVERDDAVCKMSGENPCNTQSCSVECRAEWFTSQWAECSAACGDGIERREVKCLDEQLQSSLECSSSSGLKPDAKQRCNLQDCKTGFNERVQNEVFLDRPASFIQGYPSRKNLISEGKYSFVQRRPAVFVSAGKEKSKNNPSAVIQIISSPSKNVQTPGSLLQKSPENKEEGSTYVEEEDDERPTGRSQYKMRGNYRLDSQGGKFQYLERKPTAYVVTKPGKPIHNGVRANAVIEIISPRRYNKTNAPSNYYRAESSKAVIPNTNENKIDGRKPFYLTGESLMPKGNFQFLERKPTAYVETKPGKPIHNGVQANAVIEIMSPSRYNKTNAPSNYYHPGAVNPKEDRNSSSTSTSSDGGMKKWPKFEDRGPFYLTGQSLIPKEKKLFYLGSKPTAHVTTSASNQTKSAGVRATAVIEIVPHRTKMIKIKKSRVTSERGDMDGRSLQNENVPDSLWRPDAEDICMDRMKNCSLVHRARLCKLRYYNKLCCKTCSTI